MKFYDFADINQAIADEKSGKTIKAVLRISQAAGIGMKQARHKTPPTKGARHTRKGGAGTIMLTVNGKRVEIPPVEAEQPLLWLLRNSLGLKGTNSGADMANVARASSTSMAGPCPSCVTPVKDVDGKTVTTIEGLAACPDHPVLRAWLAEQVPQCGYCQPGMIMATAALLARTPNPSDREIDDALSRVLCRCGTYQRVRRAVHRAAERCWEKAPFPIERLPDPRRSG